MNKAGYTDVATSVGLRTLKKKGLIETLMASDDWNHHQEYLACRLTETGEDWIMSNQELFKLKLNQSSEEITLQDDNEDDLPF